MEVHSSIKVVESNFKIFNKGNTKKKYPINWLMCLEYAGFIIFSTM